MSLVILKLYVSFQHTELLSSHCILNSINQFTHENFVICTSFKKKFLFAVKVKKKFESR